MSNLPLKSLTSAAACPPTAKMLYVVACSRSIIQVMRFAVAVAVADEERQDANAAQVTALIPREIDARLLGAWAIASTYVALGLASYSWLPTCIYGMYTVYVPAEGPRSSGGPGRPPRLSPLRAGPACPLPRSYTLLAVVACPAATAAALVDCKFVCSLTCKHGMRSAGWSWRLEWCKRKLL